MDGRPDQETDKRPKEGDERRTRNGGSSSIRRTNPVTKDRRRRRRGKEQGKAQSEEKTEEKRKKQEKTYTDLSFTRRSRSRRKGMYGGSNCKNYTKKATLGFFLPSLYFHLAILS